MQKLFNPKSIAVVGASANSSAIGGKPITQLQKHGYQGIIYPVNPKRDQVQGIKCYDSLASIPGEIDLVIIAVPASAVPEIIAESGKKKIEFAVILSSGFADANEEGKQKQAELAKIAKDANLRVVGPNCVGLISTHHQNYAGFGAFFDYEFEAGPIAFVTQSGGVGGSLLTIADEQNVRFSHFVHTGNAMDIDIESLLDTWVDDPDVNTMVAYIEGLGNSGQFPYVAARALAAAKPLVVWKAGQSSASASAVVSHTGRMAGDMERYRAVFHKYGVIEVDDSQDLVDFLKISQEGNLPKGSRVGVISVSGGAGVVAADELEKAENLVLAEFSKEAEDAMRGELPNFATAKNPVDVTAQIFSTPDLFQRVVRVLANHDSADQILACVASVHSEVGLKVAQAIVEARKTMSVPIVVAWSAREELNKPAFDLLAKAGIPVFNSPERALKAMDSYTRFSIKAAESSKIEQSGTLDNGTRSWENCVEFDLLEELRRRGLQVPEQTLVYSVEQARTAAEAIGYPVVVKLQSPDVPHKASVGGVQVGLQNADEVSVASKHMFDLAQSRVGTDLRGVLVQKMADPGVEFIVGYLKDSSLGGFFLVGKGGSGVEQMYDRVLLPAPITREEIMRYIPHLEITKEANLSETDLQSLANIALTLQDIVKDSNASLDEIEVNPVIIRNGVATAVDALAAHSHW